MTVLLALAEHGLMTAVPNWVLIPPESVSLIVPDFLATSCRIVFQNRLSG